MKIEAEMWINRWGDVAVFIGDEYVIYDKCDRLGAEVLCMHKDRHEHNIEKIKLAYYKNGFRPYEEGKTKPEDFEYTIEEYERQLKEQDNNEE